MRKTIKSTLAQLKEAQNRPRLIQKINESIKKATDMSNKLIGRQHIINKMSPKKLSPERKKMLLIDCDNHMKLISAEKNRLAQLLTQLQTQPTQNTLVAHAKIRNTLQAIEQAITPKAQAARIIATQRTAATATTKAKPTAQAIAAARPTAAAATTKAKPTAQAIAAARPIVSATKELAAPANTASLNKKMEEPHKPLLKNNDPQPTQTADSKNDLGIDLSAWPQAPTHQPDHSPGNTGGTAQEYANTQAILASMKKAPTNTPMAPQQTATPHYMRATANTRPQWTASNNSNSFFNAKAVEAQLRQLEKGSKQDLQEATEELDETFSNFGSQDETLKSICNSFLSGGRF